MSKKSFFAGVLIGIVFTIAFLIALAWLDERYHILTKEIEIEVVDSIPDDAAFVDPALLMPDEEFTRDMMKGVQGDFTLEQVDSMQRSWARLDSIKAQKP